MNGIKPPCLDIFLWVNDGRADDTTQRQKDGRIAGHDAVRQCVWQGPPHGSMGSIGHGTVNLRQLNSGLGGNSAGAGLTTRRLTRMTPEEAAKQSTRLKMANKDARDDRLFARP